MKIYPVIGDYQDFARALINTGVGITLVPFSDYPKSFTSLSLSSTKP